VQQLSQLSQGGVVAGQVQLFYADPLRPTAAELYDSVIAFPQRRYIEQEGWGVTANLFTHRAVLARVGMFNPHLKSSGDKEWGQRATQAGYRAIYAPTVQVGHPARSTFEQLSKRDMRRVGGWHDLNQRKPFPVADFMVELLRDLRPQPAFIGGLVRTEKLSLAEKLTVFGVRMSIQYVKAGERIRLFLGGTSRRS
jgi:hypothetical protein